MRSAGDVDFGDNLSQAGPIWTQRSKIHHFSGFASGPAGVKPIPPFPDPRLGLPGPAPAATHRSMGHLGWADCPLDDSEGICDFGSKTPSKTAIKSSQPVKMPPFKQCRTAFPRNEKTQNSTGSSNFVVNKPTNSDQRISFGDVQANRSCFTASNNVYLSLASRKMISTCFPGMPSDAEWVLSDRLRQLIWLQKSDFKTRSEEFHENHRVDIQSRPDDPSAGAWPRGPVLGGLEEAPGRGVSVFRLVAEEQLAAVGPLCADYKSTTLLTELVSVRPRD